MKFLYLVADHTSNLVLAGIYCGFTERGAASLLKVLIRALPYKIHGTPTGNGMRLIQFGCGKA